MAAIRTVQSLTREMDVYARYEGVLMQPYKDGIRNAFLNTPLYAFSSCATFLINALVFSYGGRLMAYEGYSTEQFFTIFVAIVFGSQGAGRIFSLVPDLSKAKEAGESIIRILDKQPLIDSDSMDGEIIKIVNGSVQFKNVSFSYPNRPHVKVLRGLNIEVNHGQFVALVGPSKSH